MFNKKFAATIFLSLFLIFSFGMVNTYAVASTQNSQITVLLDGKLLNFDVPPVQLNGRTLVPLRAIFEALGANMEWDNNTSTVTGIKGFTKVVLQIDNPTAYVNGAPVTLSTPGTLVNNKTMVPARFIAESMNCVVDWDESTKTVVIIPKKATLFADKNLENAVKNALKTSNETLTTDDLKDLKKLEIKDKTISSLEGLQYCTNLQSLNLENCEIKDITPLSSLIKLNSLYLAKNKIEDISALKNLANLEWFSLNGNNISNIESISNLNKLVLLGLQDNKIADIKPLTNLTNLMSLSLSGTLVQDITPLSSINKLNYLYLTDTQINDLNALINNTQLKTLGIVGTSVIDLAPLKSLKNLENFYLTSTSNKTELNDNLFISYAILNSKAKDIVDKLIKPNMSDLEKEMVLHDYIITHTKYDHDGYVNGTVSDDAHSAYGVLVNGIGVCDGYAYAMKALLNLAGVESITVYGQSFNLSSSPIGHAWNMVKIGGEYYHVDLTWDDLDIQNGINDIYHHYFNISNKQISVNHKYEQDYYPTAKIDNPDFNDYVAVNHNIIYTADTYYTSNSGYLYKIDKATQTAKKVSEDKVSEIAIYDNYIYYINVTDNYKIYRIKTDGTDRTLLGNDSTVYLYIKNKNIFYIDANKGVRKLNKMDLDGKNKIAINSDDITTTLYFTDKYMYFKAYNENIGSKFYRLNSDGSGKTTIINDSLNGFTETSDGNIKFTYYPSEVIKNEWIYYISSDKLYKIKTDGTGKTKLCDDSINATDYEVVGDWIYYKNIGDSNKVYKIKIDGTQRALVETN